MVSYAVKGQGCFCDTFMTDRFPLIETSRLMMRPFATVDVDDLNRLWVDPGVRKFLWDDQIIPRETAVAVVESSIDSFVTHGFGFWMICFKNATKLIGFAGLRHFTEDGGATSEVELLYGVAPEHWGKGIATESASAVLRYGFKERKLAHIYAGADPPNAASLRVIEKLGMKFARKAIVNGVEAVYYVMSRDDNKIHFELDSKLDVK
jgi:[ribosomal protein S5]-alanine N-acetyltransferase